MTVRTSGVLSGPRTRFGVILAWLSGRLGRESGFLVDAGAAVAILEVSSPEAAAWWKTHVPRALAPRRRFMFRQDACILVDLP